MSMGKSDEALRSTRLVFYKEDIDRISKHLNSFLKNANARCALLVDKDGHLVTKEGETGTYDIDAVNVDGLIAWGGASDGDFRDRLIQLSDFD